MAKKFNWWQRGIIYQIYPRSFQDSNGDGIGDLPGIIQRLDYLQELGVDALWLSPVYPSPMADFGYDVSNYTDIDPIFGTLADMDRLIAAAHQRSLRIILDFVPSHTSNQHPWFLESASARDSPKREWYIWHDPAPDGGPPNNWLSRFDGQSGWTWHEPTRQYYFHSFLVEQPDLNWRNPDVRAAMLDNMRFWLDRGVDGFRVDVCYRVMKDPLFRDNPPNPDWQEGMDPAMRLTETYTKNRPESHQFNRWLRAVIDEYDDRLLIGEINLPLPLLVKHYGHQDEIHLPLNNVGLHDTPWNATAIRDLVDQYETLLPESAWPNWVLGNHDQHRFTTRVGAAQARVGMMLLLTLRGTPVLYYGDEIGMHDVSIPRARVQDPWGKYAPGLGLGRDPERTPMQWDGSPNAGFCPPQVEPWLPIAEDYQEINVATERAQPDSMVSLTRSLIEVRRRSPALQVGAYDALEAPEGIFAYSRKAESDRCLVGLNFTEEEKSWQLPPDLGKATLILSTHLSRTEAVTSDKIILRGNEGILLRSRP